MCTSSVSNVIYQTFSHVAAFYTLNGKNVNAMLEYFLTKRIAGLVVVSVVTQSVIWRIFIHFYDTTLSTV